MSEEPQPTLELEAAPEPETEPVEEFPRLDIPKSSSMGEVRNTPVMVEVMEDGPMESLLSGNPVMVGVPGTHDVINFTRIKQDGTTVSIWVDGNTQERPDYIIVNPPTEIVNASGESEKDPLGAIALAIYGAKR